MRRDSLCRRVKRALIALHSVRYRSYVHARRCTAHLRDTCAACLARCTEDAVHQAACEGSRVLQGSVAVLVACAVVCAAALSMMCVITCLVV
eukprot:IDg5150t1